MLECVRLWQPYMGAAKWQDLISFSIAPKLLHTMESFSIAASEGNKENIAKLKALMRYSSLLTMDHLQAIL